MQGGYFPNKAGRNLCKIVHSTHGAKLHSFGSNRQWSLHAQVVYVAIFTGPSHLEPLGNLDDDTVDKVHRKTKRMSKIRNHVKPKPNQTKWYDTIRTFDIEDNFWFELWIWILIVFYAEGFIQLEMVRHRHGDRTLLSEPSVAPVPSRLYCYHAKTAKTCTLFRVQTYDFVHTSITFLPASRLYCYHAKSAKTYTHCLMKHFILKSKDQGPSCPNWGEGEKGGLFWAMPESKHSFYRSQHSLTI